MGRKTKRRISWIKAAWKEFEEFPISAQDEIMDALTIAAEGSKTEIAKPLKGFGAGIYEIALQYKGDAYRTIYGIHINENI